MNKTELENAIKTGESVWVVFNQYSYENDSVKEIDWMKVEGVELRDNYLQYFNGENLRGHYYELIFKTKAEAEHYLHHANVTRTETLPFLTWEEFCEQKFIWFIDKNQNVCCLYYLNVSNKIFINVSGEVKEIGNLTEANFYKAYDECVRLFKEQ